MPTTMLVVVGLDEIPAVHAAHIAAAATTIATMIILLMLSSCLEGLDQF
jgi:hypothetical protein